MGAMFGGDDDDYGDQLTIGDEVKLEMEDIMILIEERPNSIHRY